MNKEELKKLAVESRELNNCNFIEDFKTLLKNVAKEGSFEVILLETEYVHGHYLTKEKIKLIIDYLKTTDIPYTINLYPRGCESFEEIIISWK